MIEGVVFVVKTDRLNHYVWVIEPDTDHLDSRAVLPFVQSPEYWCSIAFTLDEARTKISQFAESQEFPALRDAYVAMPRRRHDRGW